MRISEITEFCEYEFWGQDLEIDSIRFYDHADYDDIAIIHDVSEVNLTKAGCVLSAPCIINTDKTIIYTCEPVEQAAVKIAKFIIEKEQRTLSAPVEYEHVDNYYLGKNVAIGEGTVIFPNVYLDDDVRIGRNCIISPNVHIERGTIIKNNVKIGSGSSIGSRSFYHYFEESLEEFEGIGIVIIEDNVVIGNSTTIQRGTFSDTVIGRGCKIGNLIDIGHDVIIGRDTKIVSQSGIASNVVIGDRVLIYGQTGISNNVHIGNDSTVYAKSRVTKNVGDHQSVSGMYAQDHIRELKMQAKLRKL